jgi:hypothetical protein
VDKLNTFAMTALTELVMSFALYADAKEDIYFNMRLRSPRADATKAVRRNR